MIRCPWLDLSKPDYVRYHDEEWGVPVHDDRVLFEFLILESAQAGLSWYTVLRKREGYRAAFAGFDPLEVARFTTQDVDRLLLDPGIIRHRRKIETTIANARAFLEVQSRFGTFASYLWNFVDGRPIAHDIRALADYQTTSSEADALALDFKRRGFSFLGRTTCHAYMQAVGLFNDHSRDCFRREEVTRQA
ncbi:DNA-3-methyladenine glycosylase I [Desulfomicrobium apsheronum]|uniref:DNA-3-methyladenine glycosylase I n=1 Tax=Desulfomicrobium apsheronum TaxID=52560 RepID=A0A1I3XFA1_9BACT|nr:DNA-3-methyladenine glycosylase I [Desulfomicrobium apsheronum]SFK18215.1 DNA-3-methyladenine glycosylase I [Desulfomicrobium apsheronum]